MLALKILGVAMLILGVYSFIITITNICTMHKMRVKSEKQNKTPFVSVCIPARNEENNVDACVQSFLQNDYPNFEVLVLDDNSTDRTAELIHAIEKEDSRVRLIKGKPLPQGWRGKLYGMKQLVENAKGEYILFTDADTLHEKCSIKSGVDLLLTNNAKMVSGYPREIFKTPSVGACVSMIVLNTMLVLPVKLQNRLQIPTFAMAIGQYIMLEKKSLLEAGGIEAIKNVTDDDVNLARLFCKSGHKQIFANMKYALNCKMYNTLNEATKGLERGFLGALKLNKFTLPFLPLGALGLFMLSSSPVISVLLLIFAHLSSASIMFALGNIILFMTYGIITNYHGFKFPVQLMASWMFFYAGMLLIAGLWHHFHKEPIEWKGRAVTFE